MVEPQQIPFAPQAQNPVPPFQGGPYAQVAAERIARTPNALEWANSAQQGMNEGLQNFLQYQRQQQQAPVAQAQATNLNMDALSRARDYMTDQDYQSQINKTFGNQPSSPSMAGTSQNSPFPQGSYPGDGSSMSSSGGQGPTYPSQGTGGFAPTMPMSVMPNAAGGIASGPNQNMTPDDPFAHMHMDPSQPYALHPQLQQSQSQSPFQQLQALYNNPNLSPYQRSQQAIPITMLGKGQAAAPILNKLTGLHFSPEDAAIADMEPNKLAETYGNVQAANTWKGLTLNATNQRFNTQQIDEFKKTAQVLQKNVSDTTADYDDAKAKIAGLQKNPANFNMALFSVGKFLTGATTRNPQAIIDAVAEGNPSLAGQIQEVLAKKGAGKLTPQVIEGLNSMIDQTKQAKLASLDTQIKTHASRTASLYNGDVNAAMRDQFPGYQSQGQGGQIPRVNSQADYDALPSGSQYYDSTGKLARKK